MNVNYRLYPQAWAPPIVALVSPELEQCGPLLEGPGVRLQPLTDPEQDCVQRAKMYAAEQGVKAALLRQTIVLKQQHTHQAQTSVQRQQALALMCRVYVGSINFEVKEEAVKLAFSPFGSIRSISVPYDNVSKKHKGFAFIEYDIPEAATIAVEQMNGVMISGYSIKVGRPSNMPQAQPIIARIHEEAQAYNRIYVASIHEDLREPDLKSVFEAFGRIVSCKIAVEPAKSSKHRGYGFIEYETSQSCGDAVAAMNLFDIGGLFLRVCKAVTPPNVSAMVTQPIGLPTASAIAAAAITAKITALEAINPQPDSLPPSIVLPVLTPKGVMAPLLGPPGVVTPLLHSPAIRHSALQPPGVVIPSLHSGGAALLAPPVRPVPPPSVQTCAPYLATIRSPVASERIPLQVEASLYLQPSASLRGDSTDGATGVSLPGHSPEGDINGVSITRTYDVSESVGSVMKQSRLGVAYTDTSTARGGVSLPVHPAPHGSSAAQSSPGASPNPWGAAETRVLLLNNIAEADEIDDDLEVEVSEECGRYGVVTRVTLYKEHQSELPDADIVVKIFVEFTEPAECEKAVASLNGRYFAGRMIEARAYDQQLFDNSDLSG